MTAIPASARVLESTAAGEVRDRVRSAIEEDAPLRIVGAGTWLDAGRPVSADDHLELPAHAGIVEYVPGDLTLTALAGTALDALERATAAEDQWLPLDPFGSGAGTLGATVATASAGPLAHGFGTARDNVLGIEAVSGRGEIIRAGGRVVKNVAGFDLTRLLIGSWGTLGVLTEITVRLRARPEVDRTLVAPLPPEASDLHAVLVALHRAPLTPLALQLVDGALAAALGLGGEPLLLARLGGNEESVRAQQAMLEHAVGRGGTPEVAEAPSSIWRDLRGCEPADAIVLRLAAAPALLPFLWTGALDAARETSGAMIHAWCGTGTVRIIVPARALTDGGESLHAFVRALPESRRIGERLPPALWPRLTPSAVDDPLSRRVRDAFDPARLLNRGILGEEA